LLRAVASRRAGSPPGERAESATGLGTVAEGTVAEGTVAEGTVAEGTATALVPPATLAEALAAGGARRAAERSERAGVGSEPAAFGAASALACTGSPLLSVRWINATNTKSAPATSGTTMRARDGRGSASSLSLRPPDDGSSRVGSGAPLTAVTVTSSMPAGRRRTNCSVERSAGPPD
jgi:hypothetical protein